MRRHWNIISPRPEGRAGTCARGRGGAAGLGLGSGRPGALGVSEQQIRVPEVRTSRAPHDELRLRAERSQFAEGSASLRGHVLKRSCDIVSSGGVSRHHCGAERMSERGGTQGGDGRVG